MGHELAVSDCATVRLLIGLVDDGRLVGILESVTVHAVVRGIEPTAVEPGIVTASQGAGFRLVEVALP